MINGALLYPNIHLKDSEIVKESLLVYENLYRIVPEEVTPEDEEEIEIFNNEYGIIKEISPQKYVENTYENFKKNLDNWSRTAYGMKFNIADKSYSRLHKNKVYGELRTKIINEVVLDYDGTWFSGDDSFIGNYMMYLATEISKGNNLCLVTDYKPAWTSQEFMNYDGNYLNYSGNGTHSLLGVYLYDYIPSNINEISFDSIVEFRDQYKKERKNFLNKYLEFQNEVSSINSKIVFEDKIQDQLEDLREGVEDFKNSCSYFKADGFFGLNVLTIPALLEVADSFITVDPDVKRSLMTIGLAFGFLWGLESTRQSIREIKKTNPYSYLVSLDKYNFKTIDQVNSKLLYDIHQFIED